MEDYFEEDVLGQLITKEKELAALLIFKIAKYLYIELNSIAVL